MKSAKRHRQHKPSAKERMDSIAERVSDEYALGDFEPKSLPLSKRYAKGEIRDAVWKCSGNLSLVAKALSCTRREVMSYFEKQPDLLSEARRAREAVVDRAEEVLHGLLLSESEAIREKTAEFILKTIGRDRGYDTSSAQQITVSDGKVDIRQIFGISQ